MQIDRTLAASLLGSIQSPGLGAFLIPGQSGSGAGSSSTFGPAAILSATGLTSLSAVPSDAILGGAYRPAAAPAAQTSAKQRKEMLREVAAAMTQHGAGETEEARQRLIALLKKDRTYSPAYQSLGQIALDQQDYKAAERFFSQAHFFSPQFGFDADAENARILQKGDDAVLARARSLLARPATRSDGQRLLVGLTQRSDTNVQARLLLGDSLINGADLVNGLDQYRQALSAAEGSEIRAVAQRLEGLADRAPNSAIIRNLLGQAQLKLGDVNEALRSFQTATSLSNGDPSYRLAEAPAYVAVGRAELRNGNLVAAMTALDAARDRDPISKDVRVAHAEGLLARGEYRYRLGASAQAVQDLYLASRELGADGDDALRGRVAAAAFRAATALQNRRIARGDPIGDEVLAFQAAYDLNRGNAAYKQRLAAVRFALGEEFRAAGRLKDAAYSYQRAYELFPSDTAYKTATIEAFRAWGAESRTYHRYDDAITAYREAYRTDVNDVASRLGLAAAFFDRGQDHIDNGRISAAIADLREAVHYDPENASYQAALNELE